jgi:hypothetical protein
MEPSTPATVTTGSHIFLPALTHATAQHLMIRGLVEREGAAGLFAPSEQGSAVLEALLAKR